MAIEEKENLGDLLKFEIDNVLPPYNWSIMIEVVYYGCGIYL
jgi:hypothetical protein